METYKFSDIDDLEICLVTESMPYRLRMAREEDRGNVMMLANRLSSFRVPAWRTAEEVSAADIALIRSRSFLTHSDYATMVAEWEGTCLGFCHVETMRDYFTGLDRAHISMLAVDDLFVRRGVGRALVREAEKWALSHELTVVSLNVFATNLSARALYEGSGYCLDTVCYLKHL